MATVTTPLGDQLRAEFDELDAHIDTLPPGPERTAAMQRAYDLADAIRRLEP